METPLGHPRTEKIGGLIVTAIRSRRIFQLIRWKGMVTLKQPDPTAPCLIDDKIESSLKEGFIGGCQGLCGRCRREIKVDIREAEI